MKPKKTSPRQRISASSPPPTSPPPTASPAHPTEATKAPVHIPPLLLEGDQPARSQDAGPGQRYRLAPTAPAPHWSQAEVPVPLPEAYGTQALHLSPRDPHWFYACWDLSRDQQAHYNSRSVDRHLVLRLHRGETTSHLLKEIHLHAEARSWFVHVGIANLRCTAQLGYYGADGGWVPISNSAPATTPPDSVSADATIQFATIPLSVPFAKLRERINPPSSTSPNRPLPLLEAARQTRGTGSPASEASIQFGSAEWTPAQEQALAAAVALEPTHPAAGSSWDLPEGVRHPLEGAGVQPPLAAPAPGGAWSGILEAVTSPRAPQAPVSEAPFWFNVNAELVIYGATEPDARVRIGNRPIPLRTDGTFSLRFALPDGSFDLAAVAVSARTGEGRRAELRFVRRTEYHEQVGVSPQEPGLEVPGGGS
ncbi:MAG: DUF4912 domain-containing protein [Verrucomicrobia bacterium]|nr:DUF4912 domain-containing protein [Verrucomicrobiota bacterium]